MRRRELITGLAGAALVPHPSRSQPRGVPILGRLHFGAAIDAIEAEFSRALGEAGYIEGKNVTIERRSAVGRYRTAR